MNIKNHTCKNCKSWGFYKQDECETIKRFLDITLNIEKQYDKYGEIYQEDMIECIDTDENFGCNQWEKKDK